MRTQEQRKQKQGENHRVVVRGELSDSAEQLGPDGHTVQSVQSIGLHHKRVSKNRKTGHQIQKFTDRKTNRLTHGNRVDAEGDDPWSST